MSDWLWTLGYFSAGVTLARLAWMFGVEEWDAKIARYNDGPYDRTIKCRPRYYLWYIVLAWPAVIAIATVVGLFTLLTRPGPYARAQVRRREHEEANAQARRLGLPVDVADALMPREDRW